MRFEVDEGMVAALRAGAALGAGTDHPNYRHELAALPENVRNSLLSDLG